INTHVSIRSLHDALPISLGQWNALARLLLHATAPGVTDTYQGDELWLFALVDPDNRRAVDYERRADLLSEVSKPGFVRALPPSRSEEHTSELQSPYDLVC